MEKKKELKTTLWLDILTYILIPFITIMGTLQVIRTLLSGSMNFSAMLFIFLECIFIIFHAITFYNVYNRTKDGFFLIRLFIVVTAIRASFDYANTQSYNTGNNFALIFLSYFVVCFVIWVYPNDLYFKGRKHLFKNKRSMKWPSRVEPAND